MPANPVDIMVSPLASKDFMLNPEAKEKLLHELGLDQPLWVQFIRYITDLVTLNFGNSFINNQPVMEILGERTMNTVILMLAGNLVAIFLAVTIGVVSAWKRGETTDIASLISALTLSSMPMFWVGGIMLLIFSIRLDWFPLFGTVSIGVTYSGALEYILDYLHHLFLPAITMGLVGYGGLYLIMRSSLLDVFTEDYILTARAIGLSDSTIIFNNALKNAMLPLVTIIAIRLGYMFSGSLLTETVFSWPGLGLTIYNAVNSRDYPVLQAVFLVITIIVIMANFIADIIYGYIDPRVQVGTDKIK
jgi:peptide/nickel transport system permease protein